MAASSMAEMQPKAAGSSNRFEQHLAALRGHRTVGLPVRFYFRHREQLLYLAVGGWNTVFGYGVWALLQSLLGEHLHYLVVVLIAWPIAVLNAYLGYRYLVFRSRGSIWRELPRFSLVYLATLAVNLVLLPIALQLLPFTIYVVQALLTVIVVVGSYLGHKYFSFGGGRPTPPDDTSVPVPNAAWKD
jgi:putative flippase GtrA